MDENVKLTWIHLKFKLKLSVVSDVNKKYFEL